MKTFLSALAAPLAFSLVSLSVQASEINCSAQERDVTIAMTAEFSPGEALNHVELAINGDKQTHAAATLEDYNPRSKKYQGLDRFQLSNDGWSITSILLPKTLRGQSFVAYYYDQGEAGMGTIEMNCSAE